MMRRRARPGSTRVAGVLAVLRGRAHRLRRSERRRAARGQPALAQRRNQRRNIRCHQQHRGRRPIRPGRGHAGRGHAGRAAHRCAPGALPPAP